ncbi:MAG: hypothetical protein AB8G22_11775 [Saprospiraceae bacterium]
MSNQSNSLHTEINSHFFAHLFVTSLAWFGPFLFSWYLMLIAYCVVQLQYKIFSKCLMNVGHGLDDAGDDTFYAYLIEMMGFKPNRKRVKFIVRERLNIFLAAFTILWQIVLDFQPLLFFTNTLDLSWLNF